jgi:hypothetical protein
MVLTMTYIMQAQSTQGLIAYYPFNGNANDLSGNGNNGTPMGGISWDTDRFGNPSSSCYFNGIDAYVTIPNSTSLSSPSTEITISLWFYLNQSYSGHNYFLTKSDDPALDPQYCINYLNNTLTFWFNNQDHVISHSFSLDTWYHLAITYDCQSVKFYENSVLIGEVLDSLPIQPNELPLEFGRNMPGYPEYYHGKLDDVRVYDRSLSQSEILELFNIQLIEGLVAHYPFNGNANDLSGNGNNGTPMGGISWDTDRFGNPSSSCYFNGIDAYVTIPNSTSLSSPSTEITISLWFYLNQSYSGHNYFLTKSDDPALDPQYCINYLNNTLTFWFNNQDHVISHSFSLDTWYHLAITYDCQSVKFYENSVLIGEVLDSLPIQPNELPLEFGRNMPGDPEYFHGSLDDARIYNHSLNETEVQELFYEGGWPTNIETTNLLPNEILISQNYPNPFNPTTNISYTLPITSNVVIKVFDILGREVTTLVNKEQLPGNYSVTFDASNYSSGIYFYRFEAGNFIQIKKMILIR